MAQTLPKNAAEERLRWIQPFLQGRSSLKGIAQRSPFSYRTLKRWVMLYRNQGHVGLVPKSRRPHHHPRAYRQPLIACVRRLRLETHLGPDPLAILLKREGVIVSPSGLGKLLKREGLSRQRKRLTPKERWLPVVTIPGELVEIDVVYVRKFKGKWLYQFTALDAATRWRYLWATPEQSNRTAVLFLEKLMARAPFRIRAIKTDNGSIFTNRYTGYAKSADPLQPRLHIFDQFLGKHNIAHYLIDPGKPQQNGKVKRSHRNDRERFWERVRFRTLSEARRKHDKYCAWYNATCPHLGLNGMTPLEKLHSLQGTNVCV